MFPLLEAFRRDLSAEHPDIRLPIIDFKSDWPALVELCGLRTWSHNLHCCPCCTVRKASLAVVGNFTLKTCPYPLFGEEAYEAVLRTHFIDASSHFQDCLCQVFKQSLCSPSVPQGYPKNLYVLDRTSIEMHFSIGFQTQEVTIPDEQMRREVNLLLRYQKSGRGRVLKNHFPPLGLRRGWRLEPHAAFPDVDDFHTRPCPFVCMFYTGGKDGRVLHVSPLLQIPGVSLDSWCVDILHTWHYGPMSTYITQALQQLLETSIWKPAVQGLEKEDEQKLALFAMRAELWAYYKRKRNDPEWKKRGSEVPG